MGKDRHVSSRKRYRSPSRERQRRSRSRSRERFGGDRHEDDRRRIRHLETLVERLVRRESQSSASSQTVIRMTVKSDCIPEFSLNQPNQSAKKWVEKIDQLALVNRWDENTTIQLMQNRLTGLARTWYDNLIKYTYTWSEWKELLIKTFPEHYDFAATMKKMVSRVMESHETVTQYYFAKLNLIQACKITGKDAVSMLIDGLQDPILQNGAISGRYNTPEELYSQYFSTLKITPVEPGTSSKEPTKSGHKKMGSGDTSKRYHPYREGKREIRCYNCKELGHVSTKCTKPKLECTKCKLLGHEAKDCRSKRAKVQLLCSSSIQNCYFVDCEVNKQVVRGYLDTGCSVIAIRQTVALNLHLTQHPSSQLISGYAGGITRAIGETTINLTVDLITSQVTALVVHDSVQSVPIIIGQPFLNRAGVTMVMRDGKIRLFERHLAALPDIDNLPSPRVTVYSKDDCVIPANTVGYIEVCCPDDVIGDVFIEGSTRQRPGQEYNIPSCITSVKNGVIVVRNTSPTDIHFAKKQLLARGTVCSPASTTETGVRSTGRGLRSVAEL